MRVEYWWGLVLAGRTTRGWLQVPRPRSEAVTVLWELQGWRYRRLLQLEAQLFFRQGFPSSRLEPIITTTKKLFGSMTSCTPPKMTNQNFAHDSIVLGLNIDGSFIGFLESRGLFQLET
jgi:hypothetical protein